MAGLSRRAFLSCMAFAAAFTAGAEPRAISAADFLRISRRLTGRRRLDPKVAALYLEALVAAPANRELLADLARGKGGTSAHAVLERTILEWWYTGLYEVRGEKRVATHEGALMWDAIGVPAPASCAGEFGAWSRAPKRKA